MRVEFRYGSFNAIGPTLKEQGALRDAGWKFSRDMWRTAQAGRVIPFIDACEGEAKTRAEKVLNKRIMEVSASVALDALIDIPLNEGLEPRPYQKAGVAYAAERERTLIADAPRLGKTIQSICLANYLKVTNHLIVCPAGVKINWQREYTKWDTNGLSIGVAAGSDFPDTDVVIINYDILKQNHANLRKRVWDLITLDEAHYLKSERAQRTEEIWGKRSGTKKGEGSLQAKRWLLMTGTPLYTRPKDLWTLVEFLDPSGLGYKRWKFMTRYCGASFEADEWNEDGATNLEELQRIMRTKFMIRREKHDVVAEIPPNRSTVVLPKDGLQPLLDRERSAFNQGLDQVNEMLRVAAQLSYAEQDAQEDEEHPQPYDEEIEQLSTVRRELALKKLPMVLEKLDELLTVEKKIVVFAHHRDVLTRLKEHFGDIAVMVRGGVSAKAKQEAVDAFTNDPNIRVFLGNIMAAGVGITLAAADTVAFVELSWVPAEMDQAEERVWLPDKTTPIQIIRYVVEDSLDEGMGHVLDARQEHIKQTLNSARIGVKGSCHLK